MSLTINILIIVVVNTISTMNRSRTQDGFTDTVSNLGQTEVVLHCCKLPNTTEEGTTARLTSAPTEEVLTSTFSPPEALTSTGPVLLETSNPDSSSTDQIQSAVEEEVDLVRKRTGAKIEELRGLLKETQSGSLYEALQDLVTSLIKISVTES